MHQHSHAPSVLGLGHEILNSLQSPSEPFDKKKHAHHTFSCAYLHKVQIKENTIFIPSDNRSPSSSEFRARQNSWQGTIKIASQFRNSLASHQDLKVKLRNPGTQGTVLQSHLHTCLPTCMLCNSIPNDLPNHDGPFSSIAPVIDA